jgi:hypothetical protein
VWYNLAKINQDLVVVVVDDDNVVVVVVAHVVELFECESSHPPGLHRLDKRPRVTLA